VTPNLFSRKSLNSIIFHLQYSKKNTYILENSLFFVFFVLFLNFAVFKFKN